MKFVCAAPTCKYSSEHEDSSNIIFVSFPNDDTATVWAHNCGRPDLIMKTNEELHLNYYICSDHIEDQYFLRKTNQIIITQGAIPTLFSLQMQSSGRLDSLKSSYSSTDVINSLELSDCQDNYVDAVSDYQNTIDNGEVDEINMDQFENMTMRFLNLCRICGKNTTQLINIFDESDNEINLQQKIRLHLPICLDSADALPQKICVECHEKVEASHTLVITSLINDIRLRKFLNLPNKYNYEEKYRGLIKKHELELTDGAFLDDITDNNCQQSKNPEKSISNSPTDNQKSLKFVSPSDLNNLILQPLQLINDERFKTNSRNDPEQIKQINCLHVSEEFTIPCENEEISGAPENSKDADVLFKSKPLELNRRCGHCCQSFSNRKELQAHITETHNGAGTLFKCGICDKTYEKWSSLDVHEATHRQDKPYLCDLCGKSFKHSNNLRGHKRVHLDISRKKRHVCETCGIAFRSRFHLREHMNQHNGTKPYVCEECGKAFSKRIQLRQHRLSHGINKYTCPICGMAFNRRGNMNSHLKRHGSNDKTYKCSVCECKCKSMSDLKYHRKQHNESEIIESIKQKSSDKKIWQCDTCSRVFSKRTHLINHKRIHQIDYPKVECDTCGKKLSSKSSLRYHVKSMHTCDRGHLCQFCGDAFISKEARFIHERIHTGERPYSCKLCNRQYRCSSNLNQHIKSHADVRPFVCQYCSKGFTRKGALTIHVRTHTGEKPFVCGICNRKFSQKNDMRKHEKIHELKVFNCEKCEETFTSKSEILKHLESSHISAAQGSEVVGELVQLSENFDGYSMNVDCSMGEGNQLSDIQYS